MVEKMGYVSKQKLPARAKLNVVFFIRDIEGSHSFQTGTSFGIPTEEENAMFENARLNATYKHMYLKGLTFGKQGNYDYRDLVETMEIREYYFEYFGENQTYDYKVSVINGRRRMIIRKNGKIYKNLKYTYSSKSIRENQEI